MRQPFTQLYLHLVWSTWDRLPILSMELRTQLYACIQKECTDLGVEVLAIGGTDDHVHLLVRLPATISIAILVKQIKGVSSHLATHSLGQREAFKWQGAYGAFTVSKSLVPVVEAYIQNQEQHHRERSTDRDLEMAWVERLPPS